MRYLMDTHILLWWLTEPAKIVPSTQDIIRNRENTLFLSSASLWEIAIKRSLGRLNMPHNLLAIIQQEQIQILPIMPEECLGIADLPPVHQDPFDRMLVIQAKMHDLVLLTRDAQLTAYPIVCVKG